MPADDVARADSHVGAHDLRRSESPCDDARARSRVEHQGAVDRGEHVGHEIEPRAMPRALRGPAPEQRIELVAARDVVFDA